jgi:hypothetical protein
MDNLAKDKGSRNLLDHIYPVPVEGPADERYFHTDLAEMGTGSLLHELERARMRLVLENKPHPWLIQRLELLARGLENAN